MIYLEFNYMIQRRWNTEARNRQHKICILEVTERHSWYLNGSTRGQNTGLCSESDICDCHVVYHRRGRACEWAGVPVQCCGIVRRGGTSAGRRWCHRSGSPARALCGTICTLPQLSRPYICWYCMFAVFSDFTPLLSVLWHCWLGVRKSVRPVKIKWRSVGVVICLVWGADCLHCIWSSWCHCHPKTPSSLALLNSRLTLLF